MAIDQDEFADLVVRRATLRRVWPEYLAAVAMVRSEIKDSDTPLGFGPFGLKKAQWDTELKDPELATLAALEAAVPGQIKQWRQQVNVFALMTGKAQAALVLKSGKDFSFIELYNAQWPDEQITSADLDKALKAVEPSITKALEKVGSDVQATIDSTLVLAGGDGAGGILGEMVGKIESKGNYNAFNRGTAGVSTGGPINLVGMTIGAIKVQQAKAKTDPTRLFAVGKYQIVPDTMKETVEKLSVQDSEIYAPGLQEKMFRKYLVGDKRKKLKGYIMGKHNDLDAAQIDLANEFASVPKPGGGSAHAGSGGNAALITSDKARAAINAERDRFKALRDAGKSEDEAWLGLSPALAG